MRREQVLIDARLVVEAFEKAGRNQLDEVAIAFLVLAEQDQVVIAVGIGAGLVALLRDVDFAADDGMDALRFGGVVELDGAEEIAMVGHGDGGHLLLGDDVHQLVDFAGAVEQGVVGVAVQVNERHRQNAPCGHTSARHGEVGWIPLLYAGWKAVRELAATAKGGDSAQAQEHKRESGWLGSAGRRLEAVDIQRRALHRLDARGIAFRQ